MVGCTLAGAVLVLSNVLPCETRRVGSEHCACGAAPALLTSLAPQSRGTGKPPNGLGGMEWNSEQELREARAKRDS